MIKLKRLSTGAYFAAIAALVFYALVLHYQAVAYADIFHRVAFYLPSVAALFVVSLQVDYLDSIVKGKEVDIRARIIDLLHWLMLVSIAVSVWLSGEITLGWLLVNFAILAVIGASVGIGLRRQNIVLSASEKASALLAALIAIGLGMTMWYLRSTDMLSAKPSWLGSYHTLTYAWFMDILTGVLAIALVSGFIFRDLKVIRTDHRGYPRSLFLKGIFGCNLLILAAWVHGLISAQVGYLEWTLQNLGFTYVTWVGNIIYAYYYGAYEYHRWRQTRGQLAAL